jgi:hypothetical protein
MDALLPFPGGKQINQKPVKGSSLGVTLHPIKVGKLQPCLHVLWGCKRVENPPDFGLNVN